jgi:hypothetical protein
MYRLDHAGSVGPQLVQHEERRYHLPRQPLWELGGQYQVAELHVMSAEQHVCAGERERPDVVPMYVIVSYLGNLDLVLTPCADNMRYSLSYCIFGFPNATNSSTSPCTTSFACEPLTTPLEDGILSPQTSTQYDYCSVDNNVLTHQIINRCSSCIAAGGETQYLANCESTPASQAHSPRLTLLQTSRPLMQATPRSQHQAIS